MSKLPHDKWLAERRTGIGGSDAAAILGINEWDSPYSVWADKLGLLPEKEDAESMRQGRDFEDYVAKRFCEHTAKKVRRNNKMLRHPEHTFMIANIDRDIVGEPSGLECKTTSIMNLKKYKNGEYPENYYCQCMHYMAVTGYKKWYLAVLVLNQGFYVFEIERDEDEIDALIKAESEFWKLVESKTPPPVDGMPSTTKAINAILGKTICQETYLPDAKLDLLQLESIHSQMRLLAKDAELIRQKIKSQMGGVGNAYCDEYKIIWDIHQRTYIVKSLLLKYCSKRIIPKIVKTKVYNSFRIRKVGYQ